MAKTAELVRLIEKYIKNQLAAETLFDSIDPQEMSRFAAIRKVYALIDTRDYDPCVVDFTKLFTPIEFATWNDIRTYGLPMWPQYPIGRYFSDFADPHKHIVIECDGKRYHSQEKDAERHSYLLANGWMVYRIPGKDCFSIAGTETIKRIKLAHYHWI